MADQDWKSLANAEYQKVVASVTVLSTASLVLPLFFIRDLAGLGDGKPLLPYLTCAVYASWVLLGAAIFFGVLFQYVSAKWLKNAHGGTTVHSARALERLLDWLFWLSAISFLAGLGFLLWFAATLQAK
ncbi:hypothetical protein [Lysobacter sp. Root916]|uniref:hypothetical protein n=1 Tax=Lysobacter sp. Root916 TaxID=1736606 RepID=UPI00138F4BEB|nr:hypothetical protein [Lysobacter sp. Root916]